MDELHELQTMADHIDSGDVQLLEWAGVPEFPDDEETNNPHSFTATYGISDNGVYPIDDMIAEGVLYRVDNETEH